MTVTTESGRRLTVREDHPVFWPVGGRFRAGDRVDPATVDVTTDRADALKRGDKIIVDNRVEVVAGVTA